MKRAADGKPKRTAMEKSKVEEGPKDLFGRPLEKMGDWEFIGDELLIFSPKGLEHHPKIASFDMDGTLITTKSGKVFPTDTHDWKLWHDSVSSKLKELHDNNFKLVIFTNQKGIKQRKVDKGAFMKKIEAIVKKIGQPIQVFVSTGDAEYRKPMTGMWRKLCEEYNGEVAVDLAASLYVGDAAGRHKTAKREKKDHSLADRFFALNVGISFHTPEQFFLNQKEEEPWGPLPFDPPTLLSRKHTLLDPEDTVLPWPEREIIVMVGSPGSGKSHFARMLMKRHGYVVANRDTLGTWQKCVAAARHSLVEGKSVVIDNTNPDIESRKRYIFLAKELKVPVRCFEMTTSFAHSCHNVKFRTITRGETDVSTMVLRMHANKYKKPEMREGFSAVVHVNFVPEFDSDHDRKLYQQYLVE